MTGGKPVSLSGSVTVDVSKLVDRIIDGVVRGLLEAGVGIAPADTGERGEKYDPNIDHHAAPQVGYFDAGDQP